LEPSQSLPEIVAAAQAKAKTSADQIIEISNQIDGVGASTEDLQTAIVALELIAIDTFTLFEARMQHHFRRGPFSRKLQAKLLAEGQADLADRVHQYYLAINVLKHGTGASYRDLVDMKNRRFDLNKVDVGNPFPTGLVDVTSEGFFDELSATVLDAYEFLETA
jgi:hypothetical protein